MSYLNVFDIEFFQGIGPNFVDAPCDGPFRAICTVAFNGELWFG